MKKEIRQAFENRLNEKLIQLYKDTIEFELSKNRIRIKTNLLKNIKFKDSSIFFSYAKGHYSLIISIEHPTLQANLIKLNPPYKYYEMANFYYDSLHNASWKDERFVSNELLGQIWLPENTDKVDELVEYAIERLEMCFVPLALNYINLYPKLIDDVLSNPRDYVYPIITIISVLKYNNLPLIYELKTNLLQEKYIKGSAINFNKYDEVLYQSDFEFYKNLLDNFEQINVTN